MPVGTATTRIVDEDDIKVYFSVMLLLGSAVAVHKIGGVIEIPVLDTVALIFILGAALLVSGAVLYSSIRELQRASHVAITAD